ncbi:unnamed protein product [Rotaria socialis]|uniref:NAD(P)(+)--arginine ADP-ribosyltransferase n=1 Tax=Rotaria socialis TaxID=392032 RepID=A0A817YHH8_9BILA|nr:unnamed protein product [Rotaria socialis]CAF4476684.1 unnamed protein product [Rotaria socialis]CAF4488641.1 unnamed protein product [Rotaria socialis]CAF4752126.1 unnamed protein product [Rotaria socialis]
MATGDEVHAHRSRVSDVGQEPLKMLLPIRGYDRVPLVTLEEAVEPLVRILPEINDYVYVAKQRCDEDPADGLSQDESAAIMLYSMEWIPREECLYSVLNTILRSEDRRKLEPWFLYLKLLLSGLTRLPSTRRFVYRGVKMDLSKQYKPGKAIVWWAFSSCTSTVGVLQNEDFLGQTGERTMFTIECDSGKDISRHSYFRSEEEILLPPGRQFEVVASLQTGPDIHVIQLKEVTPPIVLLQPVSLASNATKATSEVSKTNKLKANIDDVKAKVGQMKIVTEPMAATTKKSDKSKPTQPNSTTLVLNPKPKPQHSTFIPNIPSNARWENNGIIVAGGNGSGDAENQLEYPYDLHVDDDQTLYISDYGNNRIMEWKAGSKSGQVVAGGHGRGARDDQLNTPRGVILDNEMDALIICDAGNGRVTRWSRQNRTNGETIINNVNCWGLMMDNQRFLYVTDQVAVRRYDTEEKNGIVVAGENSGGDGLNQLDRPDLIFVDRDYSIYVSEYCNHRVMKWAKGAKEGIIVAGGRGEGNALTQLSNPTGVFVDQLETVYVVDFGNNRVMRWCKGATQGSIIIGGKHLCGPRGLSFDHYGNMYVVDCCNYRVLRFSIEK